MAPSERIPVAPAVLQWARTSAGLSALAAAKSLGIKEEALTRWETGELAPTIKQLRNASRVFGRPLAVLLLSEPPKDFSPLTDFRRGPGQAPPDWSPRLRAEVRRALSQREVLLEIGAFTSPEQGAEVPTIAAGTSSEAAAGALRTALNLDAVKPGVWGRPPEALNAAVGAVEGLGVLVIQTKSVAFSEMRGFSISERPTPVIALNGGDWPRPRLFTLLHELTHVAMNAGGLCDLHDQREHPTLIDDIEHYCNSVAAAVLMPKDRIEADPRVVPFAASHDWTLEQLDELSRSYGASSEAVLLRLVSLGKATWETYHRRRQELEAEYEAAHERERERQREAEGGPNYYVIKARDLGHGYVLSVLDAFRARAISSLDVSDYLDVRYDRLGKLEDVVSSSSST